MADQFRSLTTKLLSRIGGTVLSGLVVILAAVDFALFDTHAVPSREEMGPAAAAVVFTGQFERTDAGLRLLAAKAVPRLYISGVNPRAGMRPGNFVELFAPRNPGIEDLAQLVACCVEWGERADNTFQNARDTRCWLAARGISGPVVLITSRSHMSRARAALSGAHIANAIIPYPVDDVPKPAPEGRLRAYAEYVATEAVALLPRGLVGEKVYGPFAGECPGP